MRKITNFCVSMFGALMIGLLVAGLGEAADSTPATCDKQTVTQHLNKTNDIWKKAYSLDRWRDSTPSKAREERNAQSHRECLYRDSSKRKVTNQKQEYKKEFEDYREKKLRKLRFIRKWTPFEFGEPTISHVAIPQYIVRCETEGYYGESRWGAVNHSGSGARSVYQMMPSTYYSYSNKDNWSRRDQHKTARKIYLAEGGSPWSCS